MDGELQRTRARKNQVVKTPTVEEEELARSFINLNTKRDIIRQQGKGDSWKKITAPKSRVRPEYEPENREVIIVSRSWADFLILEKARMAKRKRWIVRL